MPRVANVGESAKARLREIDKQMTSMRKERADLRVLMRRLEGTGSVAPAVSDEQILTAVTELEAQRHTPLSSREIAEHLEVHSRNVGRKLRKLVDAGQIIGNPEIGYAPRQNGSNGVDPDFNPFTLEDDCDADD